MSMVWKMFKGGTRRDELGCSFAAERTLGMSDTVRFLEKGNAKRMGVQRELVNGKKAILVLTCGRFLQGVVRNGCGRC